MEKVFLYYEIHSIFRSLAICKSLFLHTTFTILFHSFFPFSFSPSHSHVFSHRHKKSQNYTFSRVMILEIDKKSNSRSNNQFIASTFCSFLVFIFDIKLFFCLFRCKGIRKLHIMTSVLVFVCLQCIREWQIKWLKNSPVPFGQFLSNFWDRILFLFLPVFTQRWGSKKKGFL